MTITNDERREVAARLRECAPTYSSRINPDWSSSLCAVVAANPKEIFSRLADLIEPEPECIANITFTAEQQEELFQRVMEELRVNVNLAEAVDAICGQMCGDGWDWRMRAETVVRIIAEMCGAKVVND